jgi:putative transcriptional regulator
MNKDTSKSFYETLKTGLEEAIAHTKGEIKLKTTVVHLNMPPEIDPVTLIALRTGAGMSQSMFAHMLSTSVKTVQSWEQGLRVPSRGMRRLIQVFVEQPEAVCKVVGIPQVKLPKFKIQLNKKGKKQLVPAA